LNVAQPFWAGGGRATRGRLQFRNALLEAEKEQEVDAGALDTPERRAGDQCLRIRERGAQPQDAREGVLERGLVVRIRPELPAEARHQTREDFLTDRHFRPAAEFSKGLDLEDFQSEL